MHSIDVAIVVLYLGCIAGLGLYFARRQRSTEDYFLAGRNVPGWVVAFSIMGTICSSATFIGHPGNVFHDNLYLLPAHIVPLIVMLVIARRVVTFYRRTVRMTAYEYLEQRFGYLARVYGAGTFLFSRVADVSVTYYFLALATAYLTGWNIFGVIIVLGVITVVYTVVGGIEAVVWTDVIQGVFLVGGGLLCIFFILSGSGLASTDIVAAAWEGGKFSIDRWEWDLSQNNQWVLIIGATFLWLQALVSDQNNVQRYLLARSDEEAIRGATLGVGVCIPVWIIFMVLGGLLWSYYQIGPEQIPTDVVENKDQIVPYFIKTQFPIGVKGLMLAALIAAAMSSLDSDLNAMATVVVNDFFARIQPEASDQRQLWVGKCSVVVLGVASILLALQWTKISSPSLVEFFFAVSMIVTGGILALFALGMLFQWTTTTGAYAGIVACMLFTSWATLTHVELPSTGARILDLGSFNYTWSPVLIGVLGHLVLVTVGLSASRILGRTKR